MILNEKYRFVFLHIPKAAGTSVRRALETLEGQNKQGVATTKHETACEFLNRFHERTGRPPDDILEYKFLCFVRHPVDRFHSLHRYLIKTHRHVYPQVPFSFNRFVDIATEKPDWAKKIRSLQPQVDFVRNINPWVGRFERIENDFQILCSMLGVDLPLNHLNSSVSLSNEEVFRAWGLRKILGQIKYVRRGANYKYESCTKESRIKLEKIYAEDMERFCY